MRFNGQKVDKIMMHICMYITGVSNKQLSRDEVKTLSEDIKSACGFASFSGDIEVPDLIAVNSVHEVYDDKVVGDTDDELSTIMIADTSWLIDPKLALKHVKHPDYWKPHVESLMARIMQLIPLAVQIEYDILGIEVLKSKSNGTWEDVTYPEGDPEQWEGLDRVVYMLYDGHLDYMKKSGTVKRQGETIEVNRNLEGCSTSQLDCFVRIYDMNPDMSKEQKIQAIYAEWGLIDEAPEIAYDIEQNVYLEDYTVPELQKIAKRLGVPYSGIRKAVLVKRIRAANPNIEWEL